MTVLMSIFFLMFVYSSFSLLKEADKWRSFVCSYFYLVRCVLLCRKVLAFLDQMLFIWLNKK